MELTFNALILIAVAAVAVTLGFGIYSLYRGGDYGRSHSNKLMRLRVALQAVALVILIVAMWWRSQAGA